MIRHLMELCLHVISQYWPLILAACVIVPAIVIWALGRFLKSRISRNSETSAVQPGKQSERRKSVKDSLRRLPSDQYQSLNQVNIPRLDGNRTTCLQHVVLSTFGIFVIQPQDQCGYISGELDDAHWHVDGFNGRHSFINPIVRNQYHVKALAKFLSLPEALFFSIVFFRSEVTFGHTPHPNIITKGLGRHILSQKAQIISPEVISRALMDLRTMTTEQPEGRAYRTIDADAYVRHELW